LPDPVKSPDKSKDSNHALTAFQLHFIYDPGILILTLQERYSLNS